MKRHTTFRFTLVPRGDQPVYLERHVGAARFAFNEGLRFVVDALEAKKTDPEVVVPWSGFDLINAFNAWKHTEDAGVDEQGRVGLAWRTEVCQQVFEEASVDLGRALDAFSKSRSGERAGRRTGFPRFKKRSTARPSFRLRNKTSAKGRGAIRIGDAGPRSVTLPKLGALAVREDTRRLRRMLTKGRRSTRARTERRGTTWPGQGADEHTRSSPRSGM